MEALLSYVWLTLGVIVIVIGLAGVVATVIKSITKSRGSDDEDEADGVVAQQSALAAWLAERERRRAERDRVAHLNPEVVRGSPPDPRDYRVWFGTDRRPKSAGDYSLGFSNDYHDRLHFGSCVVHIPQSHELGSTGSLWIVRVVKFEDDRLKLTAIENGTAQTVVHDLGEWIGSLESAARREILLFIPGYNTDFREAAIRAAQIGKDLQLDGPTVFYSWPSKGAIWRYTVDEATVDRSWPHLADLIQLLLSVPGLNALNVVAHSMGNRLLSRAAENLVGKRGPSEASIQLGHVVIAAPDIDRVVFRQAAEAYAKLRAAQRRTTLYWSRGDLPLAFSAWIHGAPRSGRSGAAIAHVDPIRWSRRGFRIDLLGHGYFAAAEPLIRDMRELLSYGTAPDRRFGLLGVPSDVPQYWKFR